MIRKLGRYYVVYSEGGKRLSGNLTSRGAAEKRLEQVEYFKKKGGKK